MIEKQLTIKEVIERIGAAKCISCKGEIDEHDYLHPKLPLCKRCRLEVFEDIVDLD